MAKEKKEEGIAVTCELVGLRNLKITHNRRLEFDVYEIESEQGKILVDLIEEPVVLGIVKQE